jgi:hypothetical protein
MKCITDEDGPTLNFRKRSMLIQRDNLGNAMYRKGIDIGVWAFDEVRLLLTAAQV